MSDEMKKLYEEKKATEEELKELVDGRAEIVRTL